jgi:hypothetical protein
MDALGRKILSVYSGTIQPGKKNFFVDCGQLQSGLYFIQVNNAEGQFTKRLMVK